MARYLLVAFILCMRRAMTTCQGEADQSADIGLAGFTVDFRSVQRRMREPPADE